MWWWSVCSCLFLLAIPPFGSSFAFPSTTAMDDAAAFNEYASAAVELSDGHVATNGCWTVTRSVRDVDQNKRRKFLYSGFLPSSASSNTDVHPPCELPSGQKWRLPSPTGSKVAILQEQDDENQVLEIWKGHSLTRRILLKKKLHGKVIADGSGGFGRPVWNQDETALAYVAERTAPETQSFFDDTSTTTNDSGKKKVRGGQNVLGLGKTEHWGEQYHKQAPLLDLFLVQVETGKIARVENVPKSSDDQDNTTLGGYSLGQVVFDGNDKVVYVAWDAGSAGEMPRRLGLVYCQQRSSKLYQSSIRNLYQKISARDDEKEDEVVEDEPYQCLTPGMRLARSPRFSPPDADGKITLVYLGCEKGFDTHSGCWALHAMDWETKEQRTVVDQVWDPRSSSTKEKVSGMNFPGLFLQQLPESCFVSPEHLLLTTQWGSTSQVVRISLKNGQVDRLKCSSNSEDSSKLVCLTPDGSVLVSTEAPNLPGQIKLITAESSFQEIRPVLQFQPIASSRFSSLTPVAIEFSSKVDIQEVPKVPGIDFDLQLQNVLLLPKDTSKPPPLIVVPHGGPHGASCTNYLPSYAFLCGHGGYAILMVNYRGSTGFGQGSIESLPSNIGTLDVADVIHATTQVRDSGLVDPERIGICGGSHGGFLTGHCTGQYPDLFRAAAMRNPVVNLPSMTTATDIPDWCFVEACGSYKWSEYRPPLAEELIKMREKSPIAHVSQVKTPTLVALGLEDLRVPPSQGLEWYYTLRSRGVPTELLTYDKDNHAIAEVQSEADHWIHIKQWFDKYLK